MEQTKTGMSRSPGFSADNDAAEAQMRINAERRDGWARASKAFPASAIWPWTVSDAHDDGRQGRQALI